MTELEKAVQEIVESHEDWKEDFVRDVLTHGCQSGVVGELVYYSDTHEWTDKHWNDIQDLIHEWELMTGENFHIPTETDWKNFLAWFSFEWTVQKLYRTENFQVKNR
ncbi:hypothetical protein QUF73_24880 [Cytobacillus sp. NJ13]|nr:hypothetical protein [Cytobacillus sp. NJ13]